MDKLTKDLLFKCSQSTRMTAKTFFPDRFWAPFAENIHGEIFKLVDNASNKVVIAAPRGWGKTSITMALMARYIMFELCPFIVYINKSETASIMQTENLKRELVSNKVIRSFFGPVKTRSAKDDEIEEQFSKKAWVAYNTFVLPRGAGQQVRGILFKNDRPGLIIIDDLEDKKKVLNEDLRKELKEWFYADVLECIPQLHMNWKIIYIDTLKHEDALLQHLLNSPDWDSIRLESCDDNFNSTAPEFVSNEIIKKKWEAAVRAGETDTFYQENRNLPISSKDATFQVSHFRYYNLGNTTSFRQGIDLPLFDVELQNDQNVENVVLLDPAKTTNVSSAESAIVGVGIDIVNARLMVRDAISAKLKPDQVYEETFGMARRLNAKVIGAEVTSLNEFIKQPMKNYMFRTGLFYELVWLNTRGGMKKELRVKALAPYYRGGFIYHNAACPTIKQLEQQLLFFPRSALWDLMDALAYIVELMELGNRYFGPEQIPASIEDEYKELQYEKPIDHWRIMQ